MPRLIWTSTHLARLATGLDAGWSDDTLAQHLGVSVNAVKLARYRAGIPSRTAQTLTAARIARMLGIPDSKTVTWWLRHGWLTGRRSCRRGPNRQWHVEEDDLWRFLAEARYWPLWQPERIADPALREWTEELRDDGMAWLSPADLAARFYVEAKTVRAWLRRGEVPAIKLGRCWFVSPVVADRALSARLAS